MLGKRRNGLGLVWSMVTMVALCAIASLAVDLGRVQIARTQLRAAADAAALAAGQFVLSDTTLARQAAIEVAALNRADGRSVTLESTDIQFIKWDARTQTYEPASGTVKPNAVRVTAVRNAARGNPIELPFAKMVGVQTCNVNVVAIAMATPTRYAAIGLDFIKMSGNASNGYKKKGEYDYAGSIASNGDITLTGSSLVTGDAFPGVGRRVIGANHVTGSTNPLTRPLVYPQADPGTAANMNDNSAIPSTALSAGVIKLGSQKSVTLPGGVYYVKGLDMAAGSTLTFTGPATMYVTGSVLLGGHAVTYNEIPDNFKLIVLGSGIVDLNGSTALFSDLYAPGSAIDLHGTGDIFGAIVGKSISMTGSSAIHYDVNLTGGVKLVK
jgi:hypothetical protein